MPNTYVQVKGLNALKKRFGKIPENVAQEVDAMLNDVTDLFVNGAVADVPIDQAVLKNGIQKKRVGELKYEVTSNAFYSPFIEWGTKSRAKIPADQVAYAAQFKGKRGGSGKGFYDNILAWVRRTGLASTYSVKTRKKVKNLDNTIAEEQAAFAIYLSIMRYGVKPHPFFFPQLPKARAAIEKQINPRIKRALNK